MDLGIMAKFPNPKIPIFAFKEVEDAVILIVWANDFPGTCRRAEPVLHSN